MLQFFAKGKTILIVFGLFSSVFNVYSQTLKAPMNHTYKIDKEDLLKRLSPEQYYVTQEKGTERAFTGKYWNHKEKGSYHCIVCDEKLFESETKFDAHCGWPSFYQGINKTVIAEHLDKSHGMIRTEVTCSKCGAHLGHVFNDGPKPTGLRYCINSASIQFKP